MDECCTRGTQLGYNSSRSKNISEINCGITPSLIEQGYAKFSCRDGLVSISRIQNLKTIKWKCRLLSIFIMSSFIAFGCSRKTNDQTLSQDTSRTQNMAQDITQKTEAESLKVTFIELGSVRCIPCKMMQPIMDDIEKEYADQVKVVFYDVWKPEGKPYAREYKIRVIPTQVFLDKDGNEYFRHEGYFPKEELVKVLKQKGVQ